MCMSNMYFGLQTGWVTMGSLQSAILGFGIFKAMQTCGFGSNFTVAENVIVQVHSLPAPDDIVTFACRRPHRSQARFVTQRKVQRNCNCMLPGPNRP